MKEYEQKFKAAQTNNALLDQGKSSRLLQMRQKSMGVIEAASPDNESQDQFSSELDKDLANDLLQLRRLIDQRLQEIISVFPSEKRQKLFKIRFGMTMEQLKQLPMHRIITLLKLNPNIALNMKRIADLDYNGRPTDD